MKKARLEEIETAPCRICGGAPTAYVGPAGSVFRFQCSTPGCADGPSRRAPEEAAAAWNALMGAERAGRAAVPQRMIVWLNVYGPEKDEGAREVFVTERLAREAAGPKADHVAVPCVLTPLPHLKPVSG